MSALCESLQQSKHYGCFYGVAGLPRKFRRRTRSYNRHFHRYRPNKKKRRRLENDSGSKVSVGKDTEIYENRRMRRRKQLLTNSAISSANWYQYFDSKSIDTENLNEFEGPSRKLETHIWHAKRFKMYDSGWGWLLPEGLPGKGRGSRSFVSLFEKGAVVHDASYFCPILLSGKATHLDTCLLSMVDHQSLNHGLTSGYETYVFLHQPGQYPFKAIAPAIIQCFNYHKEGNASCVIWVHGASASEAFLALKNSISRDHSIEGIELVPLNLRRLEIRGGKCDEVLEKALFSSQNGLPKEVKDLNAKQFTSLHSIDPRMMRPVGMGSTKVCFEFSLESTSRKLVSNDHPHPIPEHIVSAIRQQVRDRLVLDPGIFTHSNDRDEYILTSFGQIDDEFCRYESNLQFNFGISKCNGGWCLIIPSGWMNPVWLAFVSQASCRAAGQREWRWMHTLLNIPYFPNDMPDTNAYQRYWELNIRKLNIENSKRPRGKRITLQTPDWKSLCCPRHVDSSICFTVPGREESLGDNSTIVVARNERVANELVFGICSPIIGRLSGNLARPVHHALKQGYLEWKMVSDAVKSSNMTCVALAEVSVGLMKKGRIIEGAMLCTDLDGEDTLSIHNMHVLHPNHKGTSESALGHLSQDRIFSIGWITSPALHNSPRNAKSSGLCSITAFWRLRSRQYSAHNRDFGRIRAWVKNPNGNVLYPVWITLDYEKNSKI